MTRTLKLLLVPALSLGLSAGALAESTYGFDSGGTGTVTAKADLDIEVRIPRLILLRVGADGSSVSKATIQGAYSGGIPGGVGVLADGSDQATGWNTTAPTGFDDVASGGIVVRAWTNATGATISGAFQSNFAQAGMDAAVTVSNSAALPAGGLSHPGANLGALGGTTAITANTVVGSTWTFAMAGAAMGTFPSGTHAAQVRYTATTP
jgi:hypothetical protein